MCIYYIESARRAGAADAQSCFCNIRTRRRETVAMTLKLRSARPVPRTLVFIALCFMLVLEAGMSDFGSLNCTMSSSRDGIAESLVNLDETAPGLAKWSYPLRVRNFSPNPVKISLCMNISSCMQGTRELSFASGVHSSSLASGRLDCHPHLGVGQMAPLNFEEGLKFASVSIVFCSAAPKTTRCFDSVENPMFSKLVIPSSDPDPQPNPWIENAHSIIVPNSTNELCWDDSDCPSYVRPFCSASLKICVDEAHIDGVCTAVCGNQPLIPNMQGEERTGYDVVQPQNLLCWCHQISQRAGFIAGVSTVGALIYLFLLFWISRARSLALQSSTWGQRNAILPVYRRIFYIVGAYVAFTLGLRTVVGMEEGSLLHKGGNTSVLEITLRCIVAFLEETIIEGLIFFFLQNGSGVDQGYRALAGGITCGFIFATLTALRRVDLPLPPLTQSGSCIGCLLDRESFGYEKPGPGDCWMQLFRNIVYKGSALVLYVFILGIGLVETLRNSMCCHSIFLYRCSRNRWNRFSRRNVGRYPRGNFYRFLVFLILLRLLDMSYMTVVLGPCSSIIGSLAWLVWFPIELYVLFRSDTIYWKTFIGRISKKRYHEDYEASARSDTSLEGVSDGTLDLRDSLIGDSAGESPGWLSPDMSHWVQSRYQDPPAYHYPPTHIQLRRSIRREGSRHRNSMDITNSQVMPKHSSSKASNTSLRSNKDLNTSRTYSAKKGSKGHRSLSAMERPREIFDEDVAIVRFNRILDSMSKADTLRGANASINSNGYQTVVQPNEEKPLKHLLSSWRGSEQDNRSVRFRGNGERGNTILSSASVGPRLQNEFENSTRRELSRGDPNSISLESNTKDMSRESEHKRITIPPVESITLDFSGVEVLSHNQLDSGSTASVYEGRFQNERVAVKICRLRTLNQKSVADFVREARTLAAFNHPNVMRLVGCCPVPPHFMIVSEYCSRGNLAKVLHDESTNNLSVSERKKFKFRFQNE